MRAPHTIAALVSLLASALVAIAFALDRFDHGIWLVAYLFLVGFAAQLLLGRGQAALVAAGTAADAAVGLEVILWTAGVVLVPVGVLVEARLPVVIGGLTLLAALSCFARSAGETRPVGHEVSRSPWLTQLALISFMASSVLVGTALAWDTPWL